MYTLTFSIWIICVQKSVYSNTSLTHYQDLSIFLLDFHSCIFSMCVKMLKLVDGINIYHDIFFPIFPLWIITNMQMLVILSVTRKKKLTEDINLLNICNSKCHGVICQCYNLCCFVWRSFRFILVSVTLTSLLQATCSCFYSYSCCETCCGGSWIGCEIGCGNGCGFCSWTSCDVRGTWILILNVT